MRSRTAWYVRIVCLVIVGICSSPSQTGDQNTVTVCNIFEDLKSYSGKIIEVRGELVTGREIFVLRQEGCLSKYTTDNREWPAALDLAEAGSAGVKPPVVFRLDEDSIKRMDKLLCFLHESTAAELGVEITATFVGELRVAKEFKDNSLPFPRTFALGYGHLGAFPAQLVYRSVKGIVIRQKPQPR